MQQLLSHCYILINQETGLFISLFLAGLVGSVTHCSGMCGPLVMGQVVTNMKSIATDKINELQRLKGALLLPYHLGRATTYILLGVLAAFLSKQVMATEIYQFVSTVMLLVAGIIFIGSTISIFKIRVKKGILNTQILQRINPFNISKLAKPFLAKPIGARGYILGVLLGFLPCGLIYAALLVVATLNDVLEAGIAMFVFCIATIPGLVFIGYGGQFILRSQKVYLATFSKVIMLISSSIIFYQASRVFF